MEENTIRVELNPFVTDVLRSQVHMMLDDLSPIIYVPEHILQEDLDMAAVWQRGLRESLQEDCQALLTMLEDDGIHDSGVATFSIENANQIMRSCSAIRIKIEETYLASIDNEELEQGDVDFDTLSEEAQKAYLTYSVLANLQTVLLFAINPRLEHLDD